MQFSMRINYEYKLPNVTIDTARFMWIGLFYGGEHGEHNDTGLVETATIYFLLILSPSYDHI